MLRISKLSGRWLGERGFTIGIDDVTAPKEVADHKDKISNEKYAVVDGFISGVAALCAARIAPACRSAMVFATSLAEEPSSTRGGEILAAALDARPALSMGLRLGEASGATLELPLLRAAAALVGRCGTLEEALALGET